MKEDIMMAVLCIILGALVGASVTAKSYNKNIVPKYKEIVIEYEEALSECLEVNEKLVYVINEMAEPTVSL